MANIAVVGAGYVGLVMSACLSKLGHTVTCIEIEAERLARLRRGEVPLEEAGLDELIAAGVANGRLAFTDDYSLAIPSAEFVFLTVDTPPKPDGSPDTTFVFDAVCSLKQHISTRTTVVVKSTVPVGTAERIAGELAAAGIEAPRVVSNPEFLRQGSAVRDFLAPDRIVIGAAMPEAASAVARLYEPLAANIVFCSWASAELAKYAANAMLAVRISFMNEMAALAEKLGADIDEVTEVLRADPRIGASYLQAGLGWGGSCFPKDVLALAWMGREAGFETSIADAAYATNTRQKSTAFERIMAKLEGKAEPTVCVLGLAFKPKTGDIRTAPSVDVIRMLLDAGVGVKAHDPAAMPAARIVLSGVTFCDNAYEAAAGANLVFLATEWPEYASLDWGRMRQLMRGDAIFDGRNVLDREAMTALGFDYAAFGRHTSKASKQNDAPSGRDNAESPPAPAISMP